MSLRVRLVLVVAASFVLVVVGTVYAAHVSAQRQLRSAADQFLTDRAQRFASAPAQPEHDFDNDFGPRDQGGPGGALADPDAVTQVIDANGNVVSSIAGEPVLPISTRDLSLAHAGSGYAIRNVTVNGTPYRMLTVARPSGGAVQIARDVSSDQKVLSTLDTRLFFIALAGTVLAASLAWFIARQFLRPVERLTVATAHVAETQDLSQEIPVDRNDEIGQLAASFNTMLIALDQSREQQKRLVQDASHELRTPLTAIRTNLGVLRRGATMDDADRAALLAETEAELQDLGDLANELVELATDERADEPVQEVDLGTLVGGVVERARRRTDRAIAVVVDDAAVVDGRPGMLERATKNLVDNALKFSPAGTEVDVCVRGARIEIADRGPGIAPQDRERVFDRFYRTTIARTSPGSGLGLAIVKQVADLHGATVTMQPRDGGGNVAVLDLTPR